METHAYSTLEDLKEVVALLVKKHEATGLRRIYTVACGGSNACFYPMTYLIRSEAKGFTCESISANEFAHVTPKGLGSDCIVFAMSLGGSTKETVAACEAAKAAGATVVALTGPEGGKVAELADAVVYYQLDTEYVIQHQNQYVVLGLAFELLHQFEDYALYEDAMDGMKKIVGICERALEKVHDRARVWGDANKDSKVLYTMGSGPSAMVAYMECICLFMEMEWIDASSIHCGEFFHGPFEVMDRQSKVMLFLSDGRTRALDDRALKFLRGYAAPENVEIVDVKEYGINTIFDSVVEYFCPILHWTVGMEYAQGLAEAKEHPLLMRRYMGKVEY